MITTDTDADGLRDPLTRLASRALLAEHLGLALARARQHDRQVALIHLGLDGFRLVNDSLGRQAGDAVLQEVGWRLRRALDDTHLVARAGGDEFCLLLADLEGDADAVAEVIAGAAMAAVREPFRFDTRDFELGATAGASVFPRDAHDADALLRHADAALHRAKDAERGGLAFYAGGTSDALERLLLSWRLRRALADDEFVLHFQPIFPLAGGGPTAVEALIRWRDPLRGIVAPDDFIPAAEHTGLIAPIGDWVLEAVCRQAVAWRAQGLDVPISFNVSPRQFGQARFAASLVRRLAADALDPAAFIVEVTESVAMREPDCVEPVLAELRAGGVRLAIDDFGAGYSSLGRLRDMPVDLLKLDGMFLPRGPGDDRAARLARAALALAEALGMAAVAEGVETAAQQHLLTEAGCPLAQGFHLSPPLPEAAMTQLLRSVRRADPGPRSSGAGGALGTALPSPLGGPVGDPVEEEEDDDGRGADGHEDRDIPVVVGRAGPEQRPQADEHRPG